MSPTMLVFVVLAAGSVALLAGVFVQGRRQAERDPRQGRILYEDVQRPRLPGVQATRGASQERVEQLRYVDECFEVELEGCSQRVVLVLQGKADRIVEKPDGSLHIIDFKSGRSQARQAEPDPKLPDKAEYYRYQLMAYFLMVEQSYGRWPARAVIDFIDGFADYVVFENSEEVRQECLELLRQLVAIKLGAIPEEWLTVLSEERSAVEVTG